MLFKKASLALMMGVLVTVAGTPRPVRAYAVSDAAQLVQVVMYVGQAITMVQQTAEMVNTGMKQLAAIGDTAKQAVSTVTSIPEKMYEGLSLPTMTDGLKSIGLESASKNAQQAQTIIAQKVLPPVDKAARMAQTEAEIEAKKTLRDEAHSAAVADGYAEAIAYLTAAAEKPVDATAPMVSALSSTETLIDKADGAVTAQIAVLQEQRDGNKINAQILKLLTTRAMGDMSPYAS